MQRCDVQPSRVVPLLAAGKRSVSFVLGEERFTRWHDDTDAGEAEGERECEGKAKVQRLWMMARRGWGRGMGAWQSRRVPCFADEDWSCDRAEVVKGSCNRFKGTSVSTFYRRVDPSRQACQPMSKDHYYLHCTCATTCKPQLSPRRC